MSGMIGLLQKSRRKLPIILALAVGFGALGLSQISFTPATKNVVIAGKMGSEPDILINMYKLLIERENPISRLQSNLISAKPPSYSTH